MNHQQYGQAAKGLYIQNNTQGVETSEHDRPITSDKCLSKTQLAKHVNDSFHRCLISNSDRRLYRVTQIKIQLNFIQTLSPPEQQQSLARHTTHNNHSTFKPPEQFTPGLRL